MTQDEINALVGSTSATDTNKKEKNKLKKWINGDMDLLNDNLHMNKIYEDHIKPEPDKKNARINNAKELSKVYDKKDSKGLKFSDLLYKVTAVLFCVCLAFAMALAMSYAPGQDAYTPANSGVAPQRYIENGLDETGAVNIVAGMILDYRAFDTLGESHVLFIATITVLIMMRSDKKKKNMTDEMKYEPCDDIILQTVARFLVPVIMIFGLYVILNGHISPGGGFSGGAVIGAGLILYLNAFGFEKTEKFFTERLYKLVTFFSLAFYALAKCYSFFCGANHLESGISTGTPGAIISAGLILPLNIAVGLVVACTMYAFYAHFRKGGF